MPTASDSNIRPERTPYLQLTKGKRRAASTLGTKRIIDPEVVPVTVKNLKDIVRSINIASRALSILEVEIHQWIA